MARNSNRRAGPRGPAQPTSIRIVGGTFRGRKLKYAGDPRVRPMKDRVRESMFNLLGPAVQETFAIDLFGGTGALALEAISRGASGGVIIERHMPTAKVIRENIASLGLEDRLQLVTADAFGQWQSRTSLPSCPWLVFCSPPYRLFTERAPELLALLSQLMRESPAGSLFAVEATDSFDFGQLPDASSWDIRAYPPAVLAVLSVPDPAGNA